MSHTTRTIALLCELHHPPIAPDPVPIQRIHDRMFRSGDPAYSSFAVTPTGAVLSNPVHQAGASSMAVFLQDRFQFREELSSLTPEGFAGRVRSVAAQVCELRRMQLFVAQQVTIRTLINPRHYKDSRAFLKEGMFGFGTQPEVFGREPNLYGIRLVFPPASDDSSTYALRIESFHNDPRSLFIENQASFGPILVESGLEAIEQNVLAAYRFVTSRAVRFIANFDAPAEREEAGGGSEGP